MKNQLLITLFPLLLLFSCSSSHQESNEFDIEKLKTQKLWTENDREYILSELNRSTKELITEVEGLSEEQSNFKETKERWSINEVIEHLEVQNELHLREILAISKTPQLLEFVPIVRGQDVKYTSYATDPKKGKSNKYLEPIGRFCSKEQTEKAFLRARNYLIDYVENTDVDLRKHFTINVNNVENKNLSDVTVNDVKDLHQLLLIGIAHTDRHIYQIKNIKKHPDFPKGAFTDKRLLDR